MPMPQSELHPGVCRANLRHASTAGPSRSGTVDALPETGPIWLSILVPVFNVADYLADCLQSILVQLQPGVEVVVLDDASTDTSAVILEHMRSRFGAALRLIRHPTNRGLAAARNSLLQNAMGDYLWFVDADDLLVAGAVASLRSILDAVSPDLLTCDFRVHRARFRLKHRLRGETHRRTFVGPARRLSTDLSTMVGGILSSGQLHAWSKIARREVWCSVRFPEGRYFEDIAALPLLLESSRSHLHVAEPWLAYRQRNGSILSTMSAAKIRDQLHALGALGAALGRHRRQLDSGATFALRYFILKSHVSLLRRLARERSDEVEDLTRLLQTSLREHFPDGLSAVLGDYCRRGWLLRAWRTCASLRRLGVSCRWSS
jgi:hypothetical protein